MQLNGPGSSQRLSKFFSPSISLIPISRLVELGIDLIFYFFEAGE